MLFGLDVGEALLESGSGGIVTGDGLEGVFELAAVTRQLVGGQGFQGMGPIRVACPWDGVLRDVGYLLTILGGGRIVSYVAGMAARRAQRVIPLVWNGMMSFGGAWFFLAASESISVLNHTYALPGIGSYVAAAITQASLGRVGIAILVMVVMVIAVNFVFWRPMVAWAERFRARG